MGHVKIFKDIPDNKLDPIGNHFMVIYDQHGLVFCFSFFLLDIFKFTAQKPLNLIFTYRSSGPDNSFKHASKLR